MLQLIYTGDQPARKPHLGIASPVTVHKNLRMYVYL